MLSKSRGHDYSAKKRDPESKKQNLQSKRVKAGKFPHQLGANFGCNINLKRVIREL